MPNNMQTKINAASLLWVWGNGPCVVDHPLLNTNKGDVLESEGLIKSTFDGYIITPKGTEAVKQLLDEMDKKECYINFNIKIQ